MTNYYLHCTTCDKTCKVGCDDHKVLKDYLQVTNYIKANDITAVSVVVNIVKYIKDAVYWSVFMQDHTDHGVTILGPSAAVRKLTAGKGIT